MLMEDFVKIGNVIVFKSGKEADKYFKEQREQRKRDEEYNEKIRIKLEREKELEIQKERRELAVKTVSGVTILSLVCGVIALAPAEKKEAVKDYVKAYMAVEADFHQRYDAAYREQKALSGRTGGESHAADGFVAGAVLSGSVKGGLVGMAVGSMIEKDTPARASVNSAEVMKSPVDINMTKSSWGVEKYTKPKEHKAEAHKGYVPTKAEKILIDHREHKAERIEQYVKDLKAKREAEKAAQQATQQKVPSKTLRQQLDSLDEQGMDNFAYTLKTDVAVKDTSAKTTVSPIVLANKADRSR